MTSANGGVTMQAAFGDVLRFFRERSGLSQNGLATAADTDPGTVNRLESGKRAPVNRELIGRLAKALQLSGEDLDALLASAGHVPDAIARLGLSDPDLLLVADILSDMHIPDDEKADFRLGLQVLARRWRQATAPSTGSGRGEWRRTHEPKPDKGASAWVNSSDWGCWM